MNKNNVHNADFKNCRFSVSIAFVYLNKCYHCYKQ